MHAGSCLHHSVSGLWKRKLALIRQVGPCLLAEQHRQWWPWDPQEGQGSILVADKQRNKRDRKATSPVQELGILLAQVNHL